MLSPPDLIIIGAAALIFFGPDQLPGVARRAGQVMRDVQNTSQSFIREMERAGESAEMHSETSATPYEYRSYSEPTPAPESPDLSPPYTYASPADPPHVALPEVPMHDPIAGVAPAMPRVPPHQIDSPERPIFYDDASGI